MPCTSALSPSPVILLQIQQMTKVLTEIRRHRLQPPVQIMLLQLRIPLVPRLQRRVRQRPLIRIPRQIVRHEPRARRRRRDPQQMHPVHLGGGGETHASPFASPYPHVAGEIVPVLSRGSVVDAAPGRIHEDRVDVRRVLGQEVDAADGKVVVDLSGGIIRESIARGRVHDEVPVAVTPLHHRDRIGLHEEYSIGRYAVDGSVVRRLAEFGTVDFDAHDEGYGGGGELGECYGVSAAAAEGVEYYHRFGRWLFRSMAVLAGTHASSSSSPAVIPSVTTATTATPRFVIIATPHQTSRGIGEPRRHVIRHDLRRDRIPPLGIELYPLVELFEESTTLGPVLVVYDRWIVGIQLGGSLH
mmetsp:Transcript_3624/g.6845  ORF Transcript_3624/g.6845 Transcript_3624/m.6845 type:complete len:357 (-) Transcript_3624:1411-2481(-)